jgi:hypothetical protein
MDASQDAAIKLARAREHLKALRQLGLSRDALLALIEEEYSQQQQVQPEGVFL